MLLARWRGRSFATLWISWKENSTKKLFKIACQDGVHHVGSILQENRIPEASKTAQVAHITAQESPRTFQDAPKTTPTRLRRLWDVSKTPKDSLETRPRRSKDSLQTRPRRPTIASTRAKYSETKHNAPEPASEALKGKLKIMKKRRSNP